MRVFFGGTFDPPHVGHEEMLLSLLTDDLCCSVHLVPTKQNPLKDTNPLFEVKKQKDIMLKWRQSVQTTVAESTFSKLHLELFELENEQQPYTYNSLLVLKAKYPGPWTLAIGADLIPQLKKWHRCSDLLQELHSVWIFPRLGSSPNPLDHLPHELVALTHWRIMNTEANAIASSKIRDQKDLHSAQVFGLASFLTPTKRSQ